tara:strand:+ start:52 stop:600 length:549 start_codon:yes stop_codon:yes gene_type:complete
MNKQQKHEWLADFYTEAAKGGVMQVWAFNEVWIDESSGPNAESNPENWRIKPTLQVIDLSPLIGSGLDCEFWDRKGDLLYGKLSTVNSEYDISKYCNAQGFWWKHCQPRMSTEENPFVSFWKGGDECPVPKGFDVVLHTRLGNAYKGTNSTRWAHNANGGDIIGIEFTGGIKDGFTLEGVEL